ncbi:FAD-dependent monooxygenase [Novosphingobium kaempferiae]|uniref:FAD-dependent monooxygenase n=1 Tax=Novosphingobium kaempferiae TaxID=2896849 RepID=UPI001E55812F|nr:FAD-dependent monooxygenase [Novosphingobium kaempferiae]
MHVVIVGGGIAGLTLAIALRRFGHTAAIYEQADELREAGAGLTVWPNACRVLFDLGLKDKLDAIAVEPPVQKIFHYRSGEELHAFERGTKMRADYGAPLYQMHRQDLHGTLIDAVREGDPASIHLSHRAVGIERTATGGRVVFANGAVAEGDLVVGCDGIRSSIRELVFGHEEPLFTNVIAYRAVVPAERLGDAFRADPTGIHLGPQSNFVHYFIRNRTAVNFLAFALVDTWEEEGWRIPATHDEVLARFGDYNAIVTDLIRAAPAEALFKWGLFDREVREIWSDGPFVLLGDAAHPMLPFLGQGAGMVIEDALILARAVTEKPDLRTALAAYQAARKPRANYALRTSREHGRYFNSHPDEGGSPGEALGHTLDLNDYDAMRVPI